MAEFEEVEHAADWSFHAWGADLKQLFSNAARALFELQSGQPLPAPAGPEREVEVQGLDRETLLVNWLNELLYLQEQHGEIYSQFQLQDLSETRLRARIRGRPAPGPGRMIKAVTFHGLEVKQTAEGWEATVVVDV